jgi:hypothetical protein
MAFDLRKIADELKAAPLASPYPLDLAAAIVNDAFRVARIVPVPKKKWDSWSGPKRGYWSEQAGMLAHALATTSLRAATVEALQPSVDPTAALEAFFDAIKPLTAEMIRSNAFRQEEFLRNWVTAVGGTVEGEKPEESRRRLDRLDYRKTRAEYEKAEKARKAEAARRNKALEEAAAREAAARGWRE